MQRKIDLFDRIYGGVVAAGIEPRQANRREELTVQQAFSVAIDPILVCSRSYSPFAG